MAEVEDLNGQHEADPEAAPEGSILEGLVAAREALSATKQEDFSLAGFKGRLWITARLPRTAKAWGYTRTLADPASTDGQLAVRAADLLAHCTVGVWMRSATGQRQDFPGFSVESPAGWADLPASLVPPRPGGREHDDVSRVRALFNGRDTLVVMQAAEVSAWAQSGEEAAADDFAGEYEGEPTS